MKIVSKTALILLALCVSDSANAGKLYKWVDSNGNISYQDRPPPKGAKVLEESTISQKQTSDKERGANQTPIKVYTVENCDACVSTVKHIKSLRVPMLEIPLQNDREAQTLILERTGSLIVPTLLMGQQVFQNPNQDQLERELLNAGYIKEKQRPEPEPELLSEEESREEREFVEGEFEE